jgi:hypothetical protein
MQSGNLLALRDCEEELHYRLTIIADCSPEPSMGCCAARRQSP